VDGVSGRSRHRHTNLPVVDAVERIAAEAEKPLAHSTQRQPTGRDPTPPRSPVAPGLYRPPRLRPGRPRADLDRFTFLLLGSDGEDLFERG
jgi:hypothetical protein